MRKIVINDEPYAFTISDLPLMIHGKEKTGASLFSVIAVASICKNAKPLFFWSAYPMAKEEFLKEMDSEPGIHRIKEAAEITGDEPQVIIMDNETPEALSASLPKIDPSRVLFVKNFETLPEGLRKELLKRNFLVIAGDLDKDDVLKFRTQVFFSPHPGVNMPTLGKYEGFIVRNGSTNVSS